MPKKLLISAVAILILLGGIVFVWQKNLQQDVQTSPGVKTDQHNAYPQHIEAISVNVDEVWYNIPEYGIRMRLNKEFAEDLLYRFVHEKNIRNEEWDTVYLSLKKLGEVAPGCEEYGILGRNKGNLKEMKKMEDQLDVYVSSRLDSYVQAGEYYYSWISSQEVCWDSNLEQKVREVFPGKYDGSGAKNISEGIKTLELIP